VADRLTLATATGLPLAALVFHVAMGVVAFTAGLVAISARKGGLWHRRFGLAFTYAMIATGLTAVGISTYEGNATSTNGLVAAYFVATAWFAIRPLPGGGRKADIALMVLALVFAASGYANAVTAFARPSRSLEGVPGGMFVFMSTIVLLAAIGDFRVIRAGGIQGTRRLARHLWRMCYGLFIATGSFVAQLVRMSFMPASMKSLPVILFFAAGPLVVLLYWMWRVRLRQNLRGLVTQHAVSSP
jgi:hypothetical protein